ncbi:MAG TPA: PQQ-binding-like beta-propeller repeat protein, partial [Gemmataceae bacterium]|nr:PQQ-binding-like beta-propeller repeat protein [Gemmataceae bacterium]
APLVMDGRIYIINGVGEGVEEGERVMCFDEKAGKPIWNYRFNVFHTVIVSSRLGWTTLTADPATGHVYAHATAGLLFCFDGKTGKVVWQHSLTEEYGRISGYGGRIVTPIFDSGLVIVGMVNSSWGDQARASNRFVAFDGKTGQVVWWGDTGTAIKGTYYSSPVIAVIGGQRLLISGGADGGLHAFKVRTGEQVWSYPFSAGVVNGSPIVDGNLVFCSHGEENPEGGPLGRVICVDASQIDPKTKRPKLVWEHRRGQRFGLASGALAEGRLYLPDDSGDLFCFDAKNGKVLWRYRYATEVRGAPLIADGKLYIFDVKGKIVVLKLKGNEAPDDADVFEYRFRDPKGINETNGTPIAVNGHVYFTTRTELFCIGEPDAKAECGKYTELPAEAEFKENAIAGARVFPADVLAKPGETVKFEVVLVDANGRPVKSNLPDPKAEWTLPTPPPPKGAAAGPPALQGKVEGDSGAATLTLAPMPSQQGYVEGKVAGQTVRARVRVAPQVPYTQDFEKVPPGATPGGWVNVQAKFTVQKLPDGRTVLSKVNTDSRPPFARANAFITAPTATGYTIQADVMGTLVRGKLADGGVVNCRYTLILDGKKDSVDAKRQVRIVSWEARPPAGRISVAADFDWQQDTWYTVKLTVEQKEKTALVRGKVWKTGEPEPEKWTLEFEDPSPNREGAAALYGYVSNITDTQPGSEFYYDNVSVTPNKK